MPNGHFPRGEGRGKVPSSPTVVLDSFGWMRVVPLQRGFQETTTHRNKGVSVSPTLVTQKAVRYVTA